MKIRNYLTILFSTAAIIALLGLAGYLTWENSDDTNPVKQTIARILHLETEILQTESVPTQVPAPETQTAAAAPARSVKEHSIIFVGDSRTISMGEAVSDGCTYLGEEGEGYHWFSSQGVQQLRTLLENNPKQTIVYNFGVNDPENINVYIDLYKTLETEFTDTSFYYMSVNPLSDDSDFNTTNEMVELFNKTLKNAFPDRYLDLYTYLTENGYQTVDGLHYTEETSIKIHDYVVNAIS